METDNNEMYITDVQVRGWDLALDAARTTVHKASLHKEPSDKFKMEMLKAEHSPIRLVTYSMILHNVPMWVTTHLVRHHVGIEKFVATQRTDRTGSTVPRDKHLQGELNDMMIVLNAQSLINISRVRRCYKASNETHNLWDMILDEVGKVDSIVTRFCVPNCIYRGFCPEKEPCGYCMTDFYEDDLNAYINYACNYDCGRVNDDTQHISVDKEDSEEILPF